MRFTGGVLRITRSLRFRLALSYVFFFTIALILIGGFVRYSLEHIMANQAEDAVDEEWGAVKGYLTVEKYGPDWFYDAYDPDESFIVNCHCDPGRDPGEAIPWRLGLRRRDCRSAVPVPRNDNLEVSGEWSKQSCVDQAVSLRGAQRRGNPGRGNLRRHGMASPGSSPVSQ